MPDELEARLDPEQQAQLLRDVAAFDKNLSKSLAKNLRGIVTPVGRRMIRDIADEIPARGGLRARVLKARAGASVRSSASMRTGAGVQLVFRKPRVLRYIDQGEIPHPVFADVNKPRSSWTWRTQTIRAHSLSEAFERDGGPEARKAVERSVEEAERTIRAGNLT